MRNRDCSFGEDLRGTSCCIVNPPRMNELEVTKGEGTDVDYWQKEEGSRYLRHGPLPKLILK